MSVKPKKWTCRDKQGNIKFVGCVSEISFYSGYETAQVYSAIRNKHELAGLIITEAVGDELNFNNEQKIEVTTHIPTRYKDSHSVRFTPL